MVPLALISVGLFLASLIVGSAGGGPVPSPYASSTDVFSFFAAHRSTVAVSATLQFASAVPLAVLAASLSSRVRFLGFAQVPSVLIASTGGILASGMLMLSALVQWVLSRPEVAGNQAVVQPLADLAFATGGPGHVVFLGLLIAGIAIPAAIGRLLPRRLWIAGLVVAVLAELSTLSLLLEPAAFLLPIARFGGLAWLVAVAAKLPAGRKATTVAPAGTPA